MKKSAEQPYVSVIIPAYNQGPMLASAIDSVLAQTYPHVEIIVVNDGSPDPITRETAQAYGDRIRYIERENGGVASSRNTGIAAATGELIAWLDQDDRWLPNKLQVQVAALKQHPHVALVHSSYYYIDAEGQRIGIAKLREREYKPLPELLLDIDISPCTVLFPKQLLKDTCPLEPDLRGADDWYWCLELAARGFDFYCLEEPLAEYRRHNEQTSQQPELMIPVHLKMLEKFYKLPQVPAKLLRWRNLAFFSAHSRAVAMFYGKDNRAEAHHHLWKAASYHPQGIATGRFLQSLINSKSKQPTHTTAEEAFRFVDRALEMANLPPRIMKRLEANKWLVRALHVAGSQQLRRFHYISRAIFADPLILVDGELWKTGCRLLGRATLRFTKRAERMIRALRARQK